MCVVCSVCVCVSEVTVRGGAVLEQRIVGKRFNSAGVGDWHCGAVRGPHDSTSHTMALSSGYQLPACTVATGHDPAHSRVRAGARTGVPMP